MISGANKNLLTILFALFGWSITIQAQDLEPRFLSAIPTGGNFAIVSYGYSNGNIMLDNALPVKDLTANLNTIAIAYARSFKMFKRLAKFDAVLPYSFATFKGTVSDIDSTTSRNGFGDPLIRLSIVLVGTRPLGVSEFLKQEQKKFKLGISLRLRPLLGHYDPSKLINLGANRWAFKLSVAGSYTIRKKLILEGHLSAWLFTENKEFFEGNTIKQKPLLGAQVNATWIFKPGVWVAVSIGRIARGETIFNGVEQDDLQNNSRFGVAFAYKINKHNALKIAFTSGISTRYGSDFTSLLLAYQFMWFDKK